jgi:hypothetical protein
VHLNLIERWGGRPASGWALKTDLFEEAMARDAYIRDLGEGGARGFGIACACPGALDHHACQSVGAGALLPRRFGHGARIPPSAGAGAVALACKLGWPRFTRLVQRTLIQADGLEKTRWLYYTGRLLTAKAVRRR